MKNQRSKFSLQKGNTYLNCAYMSPLMKTVELAGIEGMRRKRDPLSISHEDFFAATEVLRAEYAKLIHAADPKRIVVIPSASYGLSTAAKNIPLNRGDKLVVVHEQFPSNFYPWHRLAQESNAKLVTVTPPDTLVGRGENWNVRILESITPGTKIVALGNVHWADGTKFNLEQIGKRAREAGARLIVDGTQSIGALPIDVSKVKPDAMVCAGYKWLMGPYSIGLGYYGEYFDDGTPLEENWINRLGSEDFTRLVKYQERYQPGSLRFEVGEHSNFILVPMMLAALKQVNNWGPENIQVYCNSIARNGIKRLKGAGYWIEEEDFRGHHLFGLRFPKGTDIGKVKEQVKKKRISVSFRGDSMRVSPHVYNDAGDFNKLVDTLIGTKR